MSPGEGALVEIDADRAVDKQGGSEGCRGGPARRGGVLGLRLVIDMGRAGTRSLGRVGALGVCAVAICLAACGPSKLSRGEARRVISERLEADNVSPSIDRGQMFTTTDPDSLDCTRHVGSAVNEGIAQGFFSIRKTKAPIKLLGRTYTHRVDCIVEATEKAAEYLIGDPGDLHALLAKKELVEISAISEPAEMLGKRVCEVIYLYRLAPTPLGELFLSDEQRTVKYEARLAFAEYDDGWRPE